MPPADPLTPAVIDILSKATGISSHEAWKNIWLLVSKSEQNNTDPAKAFLTDKGASLFGYATALSYDFHKRGVTLGIVGWTTGDGGKDGHGDAPVLFQQYKALGGCDLMPYVHGCCGSHQACDKLIAKIHSIQDDPLWIQAQFHNLVTGDGYLAQTMKAFKSIGIDHPSALAVGTVFDTSLNQGFDGKDGGCTNLVAKAVKGNEDATLQHYNAWRRTVAGTSQYNDPPINGVHRAQMFEALRHDKCFTLEACDAALAKAMAWQMK